MDAYTKFSPADLPSVFLKVTASVTVAMMAFIDLHSFWASKYVFISFFVGAE